MRLRVIAESKADYAAWVREQQAPLPSAKVTEFTKLAKPWGACVPLHHQHQEDGRAGRSDRTSPTSATGRHSRAATSTR